MNGSAKSTRKLAEALHAKDEGYKTAGNIDFIIFLAGLIVTMLIIRAFVFEPVRVDGPSMMNTLQNDERCIVEKLSYIFSSPKQGDIVIIHFPGRGSEAFVKRVIATEGQTVELGSEQVTDPETNRTETKYFILVDGVRLDESAYEDTLLYNEGWENIPLRSPGSQNGVFTVPKGHIFVMGDHRTNSKDSRDREVGAIALSQVVGRVRGVMYPLSGIRLVG